MDENTMRQIMINCVSLVCDQLSDAELAVLNNVAQLDQNPHDHEGELFDYEKVKSLFTAVNGTRMHEETKVALASIVNYRLGIAATGEGQCQ
jgi:hypothetical protein